MRAKQYLSLLLLTLYLLAVSGCTRIHKLSKEDLYWSASYRKSVLDRQSRDLLMITHGEFVEDTPLSNLDNWQPAVLSETKDEYGRSIKIIMNDNTQTMVSLTYLRPTSSTSSSVYSNNGKPQDSDEDKMGEKCGIDMREIKQEEMARQAHTLRVCQIYPDYQGWRRIAKRIDLPGKSQLRKVTFKPHKSEFFVMQAHELGGVLWGVSTTEWSIFVDDPYVDLYSSLVLGNFALPELQDFEQYGVQWTFGRGFEETWTCIARIASQYQGILAITDINGTRALVCRKMIPVSNVENQVSFEVVLFVVAVAPRSDNLTSVYCSPMAADGTIRPLPTKSLLEFPAETIGSDHVDSSNYLSALDNVSHRISAYIQSEVTKKEKGSQDRIDGSHRQAVYIHRFFQEIGVQLFGPAIWTQQLLAHSTISVDPTATKLASKDLRLSSKIPKDYAAKAASLGRQITDNLLGAQVQIIDSKMQEILHETVEAVKNASLGSGYELPDTIRLHILASPDIQAFALPNGEIFICSGLLDILDNQGELAAVIAHELCHVASKDAATRMFKEDEARKFMKTVQLAVYIGANIAGPFLGVGQAAASSANIGTQLGTSVSVALVQGLSTVAAAVLAESAIEGYSQEAELRADRYAVITLASAGYDPRSMLGVLSRLKDIQQNVDEKDATQKQRIQSSLVNAKPGLAHRINEVDSLLTRSSK